ncbi:MAG: formate--phosphoribosylaminoimidazolecarboxamide ligase [bacterium]|nr:formate--phosphoribosylaminoimidazolecarboxamide ligase [bacterium]
MNKKDYIIATLGSHTALQILKGAKQEGFKTLIITLADRVNFYKQYPFIDDFITIASYKHFSKIEKKLIDRNVILIPHGSFVAHLGLERNRKMKTQYFGNKKVLDWEGDRKKQYFWMEKAGINTPRRFKKGDKIDRPVIVKSFGADGGKGYFVGKNQKDFDRKLAKFIPEKFLVQEYVVGVPIYIHYFYSPLTGKIEIMSADKRYETNADSLGRMPLSYQTAALDPSFVVVGNIQVTLRESLLPEALAMAERVVKTSKKIIDKRGLFGPFCLETIVTPELKFYVIEISCRIVAGTNLFISSSPYADLLYDEPMSTGRRIAREIKLAIKAKKLNEILN